MGEQHHFWLRLHQLFEAYRATGATPDERATMLLKQFKSNPPTAQKEASDQLLALASALNTLSCRLRE